MERKDSLIFGVINGFMVSFAGFAAFFLISYYVLGGKYEILSLLGLCVGFIAFLALRKKLNDLLLGNTVYQICIYCCYMVGFLGLFMGVPVFNVVPGIIGAYILGRKCALGNRDEKSYSHELRLAKLFSAAVLCAFLSVSAYIALTDPYTGSSLKGMLNLETEVSRRGIVWIIVIGGISLLALQYFAMSLSGKSGYGKKTPPSGRL